MKGIILLNSNENTNRVEEEEKSRFVQDILKEVGIPVEGIWNDDFTLSIQNKLKLRSILSTYQIQVIDSPDGELQIYHEDKEIAHWNKCNYILKRNSAERDLKKQLFLEMHIDSWSIFETQKE